MEEPKFILRTARKKLGQTFRQVQDATGIPLTTISSWERGAAQPKGEHRKKICKHYGISERDLIAAGEVSRLSEVGGAHQLTISQEHQTRQITLHKDTWSLAERLRVELECEDLSMLFRDLLKREQRREAAN